MDKQVADLDFVSTKELLDELFRRHEYVVIAGVPKCDGKTAYFHYSGGLYPCLGLVEQLRYDIVNGKMHDETERS